MNDPMYNLLLALRALAVTAVLTGAGALVGIVLYAFATMEPAPECQPDRHIEGCR